MKYYVQRFRFAATGRWAVSLRTYLLIFPFGFLVTTERELIFNNVTLSRAALIALSGELASFLYLFITQYLVLGNRENELQPIWKCCLVWVTTGFVRGLTVSVYANWAFNYDFELVRRVVPATSYTTVVMALAALYFGSIDRRRTELRALQSLGQVLTQEEKGLSKEDSRFRVQAQEVLHKEILPQVQALKRGVEVALPKYSGEESGKELSKLYNQSLQIAHSINTQLQVLQTENQGPSVRSEEPTIINYRKALLPQIMSVRLTVVFFSLGAISGQLSRNGLEGVAAGLLGIFPLLLVVIPVSQLIKRVHKNKLPLFLFGFASAYAVSYGYNLLQPDLGFDLAHPYAPWYSAAKTIYGLYFASVIASLLVDSGRKRELASEFGTKAKEAVERLEKGNQLIEQSIQVGRYGTLQGKLSGVTMALHLLGSPSMEDISSDRKLELLKNANQMLGDSLAEIESLKV